MSTLEQLQHISKCDLGWPFWLYLAQRSRRKGEQWINEKLKWTRREWGRSDFSTTWGSLKLQCVCVCVYDCVSTRVLSRLLQESSAHIKYHAAATTSPNAPINFLGFFFYPKRIRERERSRYTHTCQRGDSRCLCRRRLQEDWNERERETVRSNQTMAIGWTKKIKWRRVVVVEKYWSRREK